MLRITGTRPVRVCVACCIGRENVVVGSISCCEPNTHTCTLTAGTQDKSLKRGCRCTGAVLLYCCCVPVLQLRGKEPQSERLLLKREETPLFLTAFCSYDSLHSTHTLCRKSVPTLYTESGVRGRHNGNSSKTRLLLNRDCPKHRGWTCTCSHDVICRVSIAQKCRWCEVREIYSGQLDTEGRFQQTTREARFEVYSRPLERVVLYICLGIMRPWKVPRNRVVQAARQ